MQIEVESLRRLLEDNAYYLEIKETISNISEAIFNSISKYQLKDHHRALLKSLIDDSLLARLLQLEEKNSALDSNLEELRLKLKEEIKRSKDAYGLCRKYIKTIRVIAKLQNDFVDISGRIKHAESETQGDIEMIESAQYLTIQNMKLIREFSDTDNIAIINEISASIVENSEVIESRNHVSQSLNSNPKKTRSLNKR